MADMSEWERRMRDLAEQERQNQQNSGGQNTQNVNMNDIYNTLQNLPSSGGSTTAQYTGLPAVLGGTWGNSAKTLAEQQFSGGQISYTIQNPDGTTREATGEEAARLTAYAISKMTPEQKQQYNETVSALQSAPGDTPQEKLSYVQKQRTQELKAARETKSAGSADLAAKISSNLAEAQTEQGSLGQKTVQAAAESSQPSIVQLKSGEYVDRATFDKLPQEDQDLLQKEGIQALNDKLQKEQAKASTDKAKAIQDTTARLAELSDKQASYEAQSLWDKVGQTLNISATFDQIVQEALTFGAAKTAAFDSDTIAKEYNEARLKALKEGSDLALTEDQYKDQVLSKQTTAAELGMLLVPFEYVRPGRWDEMQLWEKIVYPVLDVVSLIPVVGWAGKGIATASKGVSIGARIAALGGKEAVEFAAKDAALAVEKATAQKLVKEGLLAATKEAADAATDNVTKSILAKAVTAAEKDVTVAAREYAQVVKNAGELDKLAQAAGKAETAAGKGTTAYKAGTRTEEAVSKAGKYTGPLNTLGSTGAVGYSTVANWNDLTPEQRAAGLTIAALSSGIGGKALNVAENLVDPYKIPIAALKGRAAMTKAEAGKIFAAEKASGIKGTTRLVLDHTIAPEEARATVADIMKQLTEGEGKAKATLKTAAGEKELTVKGTGFQKTVGKTSISATPMGEIFKEGTGAAGAKSNLEKYLRDANLEHGTRIEIEGQPLKVGDQELQVKTISVPGVAVKGSEGGMYLGASFYNQFAHKAAFGAGGKISAGLLVGTPGIEALPKGVRTAKDIASMEKKAYKAFDGAKNINKEVEGFKQYSKFMEFENVITNGSQLQRAQNLRSMMADKLHLNQGEYYTRDPQGKIQLFQMYLEGGRSTPYTLKELYQLKGNALKNSLEDLFFGMGQKIDELKEGKLVSAKEKLVTKEEQVSRAFNDIDEAVRRKGLTEAEGKRLKAEVMTQYRSRLDLPSSRSVIQREIAQLAGRSEIQRAADNVRDSRFADQVRQDRAATVQRIIEGRAAPRETLRQEPRAVEARAAETRPGSSREGTREAPRSSTREPGREAPREVPGRVSQPRGEQPREAPREGVRENETREQPRETPRAEARGREMPPPAIAHSIVQHIRDNSEHKDVDEKQLEGMLAWKQGLFYVIHWKPFENEANAFWSREPIPGVKYFDGIGSAAKSAVALYGEIPKSVRIDMGIMDVTASRNASDTRKPILRFTPDPRQRTHYQRPAREGLKKGK